MSLAEELRKISDAAPAELRALANAKAATAIKEIVGACEQAARKAAALGTYYAVYACPPPRIAGVEWDPLAKSIMAYLMGQGFRVHLETKASPYSGRQYLYIRMDWDK